MRSLRDVDIRWKAGLLLCIILLLVLVQLAGVWWFIQEQSADGTAINEAGEQRMLTQKIAWEAHQVGMGHDRHGELADAADEFDRTLDALISGNDTMGLPASPPAVSDQLAIVETKWEPYQAHVQTLLAESHTSEEFNESLTYVETHHQPLLEASDRAVNLYEQAYSEKVQQFQWFVSGVFVFFLLLIPVLFAMLHRHVLTPLEVMAKETQTVADGALDEPITVVRTEDEVGVLSRAISEMKEQLVDSLETEQQFRKAVQHAGHAIVITDDEGTIEFTNPAFEEVTGYPSESASGSTLELLHSSHHPKAYSENLWSTLLEGETSEELWSNLLEGHIWEDDEMFTQRRTGEMFIADTTIAPIFDDEDRIDGFVSIMADRTEERVREQQNQVLSRVLRHNLRNELNLIDGYAVEVLDAEDSATQAAFIERIRDSVDALSEKAETANRAIHIIERDDTPQSYDVSTAIGRVCERIEQRYPHANINTELPSDEHTVQFDVETVVEELVENALVHNDRERPEVLVRVRHQREAPNDQLLLQVADDGPGIPEDERAVIEEGHETPLIHGSGLGLWFVYWMVTLGGGEISISQRVPRGTRVSITLPYGTVTSQSNDTALGRGPSAEPERDERGVR